MWGLIAGAAITTIGGLISSNQQKQAAKGAANAQKAATNTAIAEEQRQFDAQMEEYQRKQAILEQQQARTTQLMSPYIQAGQGALYELMALSGVAMPQQPTTPAGLTAYQPSASERASLLPATSTDASGNITVGGAAPGAPTTGQVGIQSTRGGALGQIAGAVSGALGKGIQETVESAPQIQQVQGAVNPYAGMTGQEAQAAAIEKIASSPLLQELTAQGEQALLQQASATGGLRGGNIQGALAQYRPQMLQQAISDQYNRLGSTVAGGQTATSSLPYINQTSYPTNNLSGLYQDLGSIQAGNILGQSQAQGQIYSNIAQGLGTAAGAYFNRNKES